MWSWRPPHDPHPSLGASGTQRRRLRRFGRRARVPLSHIPATRVTLTSDLFPFLSGCEIKETPEMQPKPMPSRPATTEALSELREPSQTRHLLCSLPSACWAHRALQDLLAIPRAVEMFSLQVMDPAAPLQVAEGLGTTRSC